MKSYVKEYKGYKVPEGATHLIGIDNFYKVTKDAVYYFDNVDGFVLSNADHYYLKRNLEPLPEAPQEWSGEGLPPIGTICEYQVHKSKFGKCLVMGYFEGLVWMTSHHETSPYSGSHTTLVESTLTFRPLKTQQEKDREAFVECVKQLLPKSDTDDLILSGKLFDLGFTAPKAGE